MKKIITSLKYINFIFLLSWSIYLLGSCNKASDTSARNATGVGGSLARFTVVNNHLYTVGNQKLNVFDISTPTTPKQGKSISLGWGIETIFPFGNTLLIGSTTGVHAYDISTPDNPTYLDRLEHMRSCDPVVAQGKHAFVTLRAGNMCGGVQSRLEVLDISDLRSIKLLKAYGMNNPYGLGVDGNHLFVCEGDLGLKVFDNTDPLNLKETAQFSNIHAYDVIPLNGLLLLIGDDGLFQYRYSNQQLTAISSIPVVKK